MEADYAPGRRNIGPGEVRRRLRLGLIGLAAGILVFLGLLWTEAPRPARLLLAVPLLVSFLGFVQASCETWVVMGMRGIHRMNGDSGRARTAEEREADRKRSLRLWALVGLSTLTATSLAMLVP